MTDNLFQIVAAGGTVLTANKRLARELLHRYDRRQSAAGLRAWPTPAILPLEGWFVRQLQATGADARLLTEAQAQHLWDEVVAADAAVSGRDLLQVPKAARRARDAQQLLGDYLADFAPGEADEDPLAFLRWRKRCSELCAKQGWLDRSHLPATVLAALDAGRLEVPEQMVLAGFDDLTPAERQLCAALETHGCQVLRWESPPVSTALVGVHAAVDRPEEVRSCARWVRHWLERDPQARVGVVAPRLYEYQGLIERIFRAELDPPACLSVDDGPDGFTLSLGTPLAREGVVRAALRLLAAGEPLRLDDLGWLLRTPYLGGARTEWLARAAADRLLRERGRAEWHLAVLPRTLAGAPRMAATIEVLQLAVRDRQRRLPGEWAERFARQLDQCGWPGERGLSSREFQATAHFKEALSQLASLDRVAKPLERGTALAILNRLASETIFQPEGGEGRVQVLGMLEAGGFDFTALWVLGLHDGAFPAPARPNPFLPLALQSRLRMPHADADREREFAERLARRLFASAPEVVVSWPRQLDGAPCRPSPLLRQRLPASLALAPSCDPFLAMRAEPCQPEVLVDDRAMPIAAGRPFSGGTTLLKDQALCPFRAMAHHRLHAARLEAPDLGLDNLARGNLVHGVLERFWRLIAGREALLCLTAAQQEEVLATVVEETLQQHERRSRCDLPARLRALEGRRLTALATRWLGLERLRPPFAIAEIEQRHEARVGRLRLRTRIDRIDELDNGQLAIIDYKTGNVDPRQWLDGRVTEPQLPLYCLGLADEQIGAVLFARIRSREKECAFKGVARAPDGWPGLSARQQEKLLAERGWLGFDEIIAHWRRALPALGDAFADGQAVVDPVDQRRACRYCDLATLCRIVTTGADDDETESEAADDE